MNVTSKTVLKRIIACVKKNLIGSKGSNMNPAHFMVE